MLFDISLKYLLGARPQKLFQHACGLDVVSLAPAEWQALQLRPDLFGRLANGDWLHAEVQSDPVAEMPWRMLGYFWLAWYNLGVTSLTQIVFVLRGKAAGMPQGLHLLAPQLQYRYQVVVFEEIDVEVLTGGTPEESILSLLCRGGTAPERVREVLRQCLELPKGERDVLLHHLQVISGLRPGLAETVKEVKRAMPLTIDLRENLFWQEANAEGIQQGQASLLQRQLNKRFGPLPEWAQQRLTAASLDDLGQWGDRVLTAASLDEIFAR